MLYVADAVTDYMQRCAAVEYETVIFQDLQELESRVLTQVASGATGQHLEELDDRVMTQMAQAKTGEVTGQHLEEPKSLVMSQVAIYLAQDARESIAQALTLQGLRELESRVLLQAAQIYKDRMGDPGRAAELLEKIASDYPRSALAAKAKEEAERLRGR